MFFFSDLYFTCRVFVHIACIALFFPFWCIALFSFISLFVSVLVGPIFLFILLNPFYYYDEASQKKEKMSFFIGHMLGASITVQREPTEYLKTRYCSRPLVEQKLFSLMTLKK